MIRRAVFVGVLLACFGGPSLSGMAEPPAGICQDVASRIRGKLTGVQMNERGPLEALAALGDASFRLVRENPRGWVSGATQAARLRREHAALQDLAEAVEALGNNVNLIEVPGAPIWVFDTSSGSLGCHRLIAASVPAGSAADVIGLPFGIAEADLCGSEIMAGEIGGRPALITEENRADFDHFESNITITPFVGFEVGPSCDVNLRYALTLRAEHAFCREGVDCGAIMRAAEEFVDKRRAGANASTFGNGVPEDEANRLRTAYDRMQQIDGEKENLDSLPTFNKFLHLGADGFGQDAEIFPFQIWTGDTYLARLGHGRRGAYVSVGYIFAAYGLSGDRTVPVAGISVEPRRGAITSIEVR